MSREIPRNLSASVHQKLLNKAKLEKRPFSEVLQYYAMERFLYRLSISEYGERFVLKGGMMLRVWESPVTRPTMDIDLLARTSNELEAILHIFKEVCELECTDDGLLFNKENLEAGRIKEDARYEGVRVTFLAFLGPARVRMQVDIGFDDIIHPRKESLQLPSMLDLPAARMDCYSRESVIAEKYEAMSTLGLLNSRMKDFYDIWLLSSSFSFDGPSLAEAIRKTFEHRASEISSKPVAFSEAFIEDKEIQWKAFRRKLKSEESPADLGIVVQHCRNFLVELSEDLFNDRGFTKTWPVNGPWED